MAIASTVSRRGWRRRHGTPMTIHATGETRSVRTVRKNRSIRRAAGVCVPAVAGGLCARLAHQVNLLPDVLLHLGRGRRFRAKAPRNQPEAGRACPLCQGPLPASSGPVPGPGGGLDNNGATACTHPDVREGLAPSRCIKATHRNWALLSSRAIPALSPRRRVCAKLPGCRHPGVAARRVAGRRRCSGPAASALAPRRSSAQAGSPGRAAGPVSPLAPPAGLAHPVLRRP